MRPGLLVKYTRWQQIRDNKKHFAAKNLHYSVDKICNLNYMGDSSPFHTMDIYSPKDRQDVLPVVMLIHGGGYVACEKFINALNIPIFTTNIGDTRTIITYPYLTTHRQLSAEQKLACGIGDDTMRLSVGLEDVDDLIEDLSQALDSI